MLIYCPACETEATDDDRVCVKCGHALGSPEEILPLPRTLDQHNKFPWDIVTRVVAGLTFLITFAFAIEANNRVGRYETPLYIWRATLDAQMCTLYSIALFWFAFRQRR